ncbi:Ku70/Ku80 beta-barrel domain containing protein [Nitzschia inconspicua]|uniref:Ku70/Ku80 beta-barrel domain containing protein n=1 Tax=Nitzschia inconspicua TaxID=303405 RepID=A0A9K3KGI5_9STRA|nr:Ku70/Ku80 beta-barrel domain containing protein [Nitzschia inconspicua]
MGKEAVVVIIDSNATMSRPMRMKEPNKTRLDCAKEVAIAMVSDLMIQSKTNEVTVVVLNTKESRNFLCKDYDNDNEDDEEDINTFSNMMEFSGNGSSMGIQRPTPDLLRKIQGLQVTSSSSKKEMKGGDFVAGIIYAADALHQRTAGKKYERRIILLTDAEHKVSTNPKLLLVALDSLRAMETRLEVVGMNFEYEQDFDDAAAATIKQEQAEKESDGKQEPEDGEDEQVEDDDGSSTDMSEDEENEDTITAIKRENERFLLSLANKTGGFVFAAKELQSMFDKILGRRVIVPSKRKLSFQIAPGITLDDARYYLLLSKASTASLKKKVVEVDENNVPKKNSFGVEMVDDYVTNFQHWDAAGDEVPWDQISKAFRFGADLLPFNDIDEAGLMQPSPVKLTILGYMDTRQVPEYLRIGPPYILTGNDSRRCCAAISALARALKRTKKVAIATFVKTKDKDPILCGLFPLEELEEPLHLVIMQLPFSNDIRYFPELPSLDDISVKASAQVSAAADSLIDNLMLPDEALDYRTMANPNIRSFYKTVVDRVFDRNAPVVNFRTDEYGHDRMGTPDDIEKKAKVAVDTFYKSFQLKKVDKDSV